MNKIGKNIKTLRTKNKMSQEDLAQKLFVTRQTISNYETGKSNPDVEMIIHIGEVFETDANELIYGVSKLELKKSKMIKLLIRVVICLVLVIAMYYLEKFAIDLSLHTFNVGPLWIIKSAFWPFIYVFVGWTMMFAIHIFTGAKPLGGKFARTIHYIIIIIIVSYIILLLPMWIWLIKSTVEQFVLLKSGGEYSYESSLSLTPLWNKLSTKLQLYAFHYSATFIFMGIGVWLTKTKP
ncbi:MAG: helix-turn-helix domain-containing protein [Lachnotalea sp.]